MKLIKVYIQNFRCYKREICVDINDLTTFIGKNDIGKSTIMEALEIFFNNEVVKINKEDLNNKAENSNIVISCEFNDLPKELVLDADAKTNLQSEYLLTKEGTLKIKKIFDCSKKTPSSETYIIAYHPTAKGFSNLLSMKRDELKEKVQELNIEVNKNFNSDMRKAIWKSVEKDTLKLNTTEICVSKAKEGARDIWTKLENYIPAFALFQNDRNSTDEDSEVQNPMKYAVQLAIDEAKEEIERINEKVRSRAMEIAENTHAALKSLDENLASSLSPKFDPPTNAKWTNLFSISMDTDDNIPLNKRGSGIRRMVLLSFFKAEAERKATSPDSKKKDVIYAIEEPETSLHPSNQLLMIKSLLNLSKSENCQVILTTHSPSLANELPVECLRFVTRSEENVPDIRTGENVLPDIIETLGILPEANSLQTVKVMLCVEGPTDIPAFLCFNRCLHKKYHDIVDIENDKRIVIMPLGGSILKYWVTCNYLKKLNCKEVHIYDRDVKCYQDCVEEINKRGDGSWGKLTKKYEIENYLHTDAIKSIYHVDVDTSKDKVPEQFAKVYSELHKIDTLKAKTAKSFLSKVFNEGMTMEYITQIGAEEELKGWFDDISKMLEE